MPPIPFVGPTYTARSTTIDAQRCVNWYLEEDQGQGGPSPAALLPTPGYRERYDLQTGPIRGLYASRRDARVFAVASNTLFELFADNTFTARGELKSVSGNVSMIDNFTQLYITDGEDGYIFTYATNAYAPVSFAGLNNQFGPSTYQDGYFITVKQDTEQFYISALNDGLTWNATDFSAVDSKPDNLVAAFSDQRNLWLFGEDTTEIWYNSGAINFPFQRIQGAVLDVGAINPWCIDAMSGTFVWLGINIERGDLIVYRSQGPGTLQRISTHAIELIIGAWAAPYASRTFTYQEDGHYFWVLWNPEGCVVYDLTTGMWHERLSLDANGFYTANHAAYHCIGFADNLVGDPVTGQIYAMRLDVYDDNGQPLPRMRRGQYVDTQRRLVRHARFELDFARGVGLDGAGSPEGTDPQWQMRWSDTYGQTWNDYRLASQGRIGQFTQRARWHRLGVSRSRIYEVYTTSPVRGAIVGAYLNG